MIGVLCPTAIAQSLGLARPIFVSLGDVKVDWSMPQSEGYRAMFDAPNGAVRGASRPAGEASSREAATSTVVLEGTEGEGNV